MRIFPLLALAFWSVVALSPAHAETDHRIVSKTARHRWKLGHWEIRAEPGGACVAMAQSGAEPDGFWGFIQTGPELSHLELYFDSRGPAQPQTLKVTFNEGAMNTKTARVQEWAGMDSYVVSLSPDILTKFRSVTDFAAYLDGKMIWSERGHWVESGS
jgi:hypothetical protein